jgi:hypothetical protein
MPEAMVGFHPWPHLFLVHIFELFLQLALELLEYQCRDDEETLLLIE